MKINNRRKGMTYLDYQDGQVISVEEDENLRKDFVPQESANIEFEIKGKKIQINPFLKILKIVIAIILCSVIFNNLYISASAVSRVFDFLGSDYITTNAYNEEYNKNKNEQLLSQGSEALNPLDFEGKKELEERKNNAIVLMNSISKYDKKLMSYYETLKENITTYMNGNSSYYLMNASLVNLNKLATMDYEELMNSTFVESEMRGLFLSRYKILFSFLSANIDNFTSSSLVKNTNDLIAEDNVLNLKEYELLKQHLTNNGISYVEENNKIKIK